MICLRIEHFNQLLIPSEDGNHFTHKMLNHLVDSFSVYALFCIPIARRIVRLRSELFFSSARLLFPLFDRLLPVTQ
jgi:hypothetical protein